MKPLFRTAVSVAFLMAAHWLPVPAAQAQRATDGPPLNDPFGRRVVPARAGPGGRYRAHSFDQETGTLTIQATDGSTRQIQESGAGVLKVSYFVPGRQPVADSSISVPAIHFLPGAAGVGEADVLSVAG